MAKPINVFWAPHNFASSDEQWNLLYSPPKLVVDNMTMSKTHSKHIIKCPATRSSLKNVYSLNSAIDDTIDISGDSFQGRVALYEVRQTSFPEHRNLSYNLSWAFFSDEPLVAKMTAPYFPATAPADGAILSVGEYDIGQWFRPINLDYHIPKSSTKFEVKADTSLAFVEFKTDRPIVFKRFRMTQELIQIGLESAESPDRYGSNLTLVERYKMARNAGLQKIVLRAIKDSLVD